MTDSNDTPKGLVDRLVDLFRSNPPEKTAEELETQLDETRPPATPSKDDDMPIPLYKGVTL